MRHGNRGFRAVRLQIHVRFYAVYVHGSEYRIVFKDLQRIDTSPLLPQFQNVFCLNFVEIRMTYYLCVTGSAFT